MLFFRKDLTRIKSFIRNILLFFILLSFVRINHGLSANDSIPENLLESDKDSTKIIEFQDTVFSIPSLNHGSIFLINDKDFIRINKHDILFDDYTGLSEILQKRLFCYPLSLGSYGSFNQLSVFGAKPKDNSFYFNGRSINDFQFSSINPEQLPVEFYENIEIITGSDAVILSDNSSGLLINLQEIKYNTKTPYTKIWFSEAGYDFIGSDGIFSQNMFKNTNLAFGYRRESAKGRYDNSWVDSWNIRGLFRWNPDDLTSLSLSENFTNHGLGLNGGVDNNNSADIYDDIAAAVNYTGLNERVFRHDLTLSYSSFFNKSKTEGISANIYATFQEWNLTKSNDLILDENDSLLFQKHHENVLGINTKFETFPVNFLLLRFGGELNKIILDKTLYSERFNNIKYSGFAQGKLIIDSSLFVSGGIRFTGFDDKKSISFGSKAGFIYHNDYYIFDISYSERIPTAIEGFGLKNEKIWLGLIDIKRDLGNFDINLNLYYRHTFDPVAAIPIYNNDNKVINLNYGNQDNLTAIGAGIRAFSNVFDNFYINLKVQSEYSKINDKIIKRVPYFWGNLEIYYEIKKNKSILRLGSSIELSSSFMGYGFFPIKRDYYEKSFENGFMFNGIDVFAKAKLGNAYVRLSYKNLLSNGWFYVPFYPQPNGNLRLSVSWAFLD